MGVNSSEVMARALRYSPFMYVGEAAGTGSTGSFRSGGAEWVAPTRHDPRAAFNDIAAIVGEAHRKSEKQGRPVRTRGIGMLGDFAGPSLIKENIR